MRTRNCEHYCASHASIAHCTSECRMQSVNRIHRIEKTKKILLMRSHIRIPHRTNVAPCARTWPSESNLGHRICRPLPTSKIRARFPNRRIVSRMGGPPYLASHRVPLGCRFKRWRSLEIGQRQASQGE